MDETSLLTLGALAGAAHVVLAPDHLVALLVFSAEARQRAWRVGLSWGVGHAGAIAAVALAALEVRERLHWDVPEGIGESMGGLILIAIGGWGLYHVRAGRSQGSEHASLGHAEHAGHGHIHTGLAFGAGLASGVAHGLVGHGALFATLPVLGLDRPAAHRYLIAFAAASVLCVVALTSALGALSSLPFRAAGSLRHYPRFLAAVALGCVLFGTAWLVLAQLGFELHGPDARGAPGH